jgi:hypothetical protein
MGWYRALLLAWYIQDEAPRFKKHFYFPFKNEPI